MKFRSGYLSAGLLCGLLLAQPLAYARKSQDEAKQDEQQNSAPIYGGYLGKDQSRNKANDDRGGHDNRSEQHYESEQRYEPIQHYESGPRYQAEPRYESAPRYAPRGMNLSEAVSVAERSTGGRVLSAEPLDENGQLSYRVKVLTPNGRVQVLFIDAQ